MNEERYERGLENLKKIHGNEGELFIESIESISPDFDTLSSFHWATSIHVQASI
jgi:hypothetical protein